MTPKERLLEILKYSAQKKGLKRMGQNKFETEIGLSVGYINKVNESIGSEIIKKIVTAYPELNVSWIVMGNGSMLLSEEKENLCEKKSNLTKQKNDEERNIDELITNQIKKSIMEQIPSIISAVMAGMTTFSEGQNKVILAQIEAMKEIVTESLNSIESKAKEIDVKTDNLIKLNRNVG